MLPAWEVTPISDDQQRDAVITGAAGGTGWPVAAVFAGNGTTVGLPDVGADRAREVGGGAVAAAADVRGRHDVDAALPFPGIDVLVDNAGIRGISTFEELSHDSWSRVIGIDLGGAFYCGKARYLRRRKPGSSIVNVSPAAGLAGIPRRVPHSVGRHGLIGPARGLARHLGRAGVRINAISGVTEVPLTAGKGFGTGGTG